jgi:hypothetical protein
MPIRISDASGYATYSAMASGLYWAADHGARVANISYIASDSSSVATAAQYFQSKGGVVTVSSGNQGTFCSSADNRYVLTVGATDSADNLASWSNTGNNVDLVAPGVSIYTTANGGGYRYASGTSFSAPVTAGVAALVIAANPNLSAAQVQDILKQSADDRGAAGWDTSFGAGRVNAGRAVSFALGVNVSVVDATPPTVGIVSPGLMATVGGTTTVQLSASDNAGVASVRLEVDGVLVGKVTSSPYTMTWNTTLLSDGTHTLRAVATDTSGNTASAERAVTVRNTPDTTAPIVTITGPAAGTLVNGNVSVTVNASDNVGVTRVELYVDGKLTSTSTAAPFTTNWNARKAARGTHTLQCRAYDAAGNVATSATVTVTR